MFGYRKIMKALGPWWLLATGDGEKLGYVVTALADIFVEKLRLGLEARLPSRASPSANKLTAGDRGLVQGRWESSDDFVARLQAWRTPRTHRVRGNAYEAIDQIWRYFARDGAGPIARTIDPHGVSFERIRDGSQGRDDIDPFDWDGLDPDVHFARYWLYLDERFFTSQGFAAVPSLDLAAPGDTSNATGAGQTQIDLTLACDGRPGRLIFVHVAATDTTGQGTVTIPGYDFAEIVNQQADDGQNTVRHWVFWYIVPEDAETFATVPVRWTKASAAAGGRIMSQAVNVEGFWPDHTFNPIKQLALDTENGSTTITVPDLDGESEGGGGGAIRALAFFAGKTGTYSAVSGGTEGTWTDLGERIAGGPVGIGVDTQHVILGTAGASGGVMTHSQAGPLCVAAIRLHQSLWGGAIDTPGHVLGIGGMTPDDAQTMRAFFQELAWGPGHATAEWLIVGLAPGAALDAPFPEPDGTWGNWSDGAGAPVRDSRFRYIALDPKHSNAYSGDSELYSASAEWQGGLLEGDPESWGTWAGSDYTENPERFAVDVVLVDDGSIPRVRTL